MNDFKNIFKRLQEKSAKEIMGDGDPIIYYGIGTDGSIPKYNNKNPFKHQVYSTKHTLCKNFTNILKTLSEEKVFDTVEELFKNDYYLESNDKRQDKIFKKEDVISLDIKKVGDEWKSNITKTTYSIKKITPEIKRSTSYIMSMKMTANIINGGKTKNNDKSNVE